MKRCVVAVLAACSLLFPHPALADQLVDTTVIDGQVEAPIIEDSDAGIDHEAGIEDEDAATDEPETIETSEADNDEFPEASEPEAVIPDPETEGPPAENGWTVVDGTTYYVDPESGEHFAGGVYDIEGKSYCFDPDGALVTGWMAIDGDVFYFDPETGAMLTDCTAAIEGLCAPIASADASSFSDVSASTPHSSDIDWLLDTGISTGWVSSDGSRSFRPMNDVARADMAAFLYRLAGSPSFTPSEQDTSYFTDVTPDTPHAAEVWWLAHAGISTGWNEPDGTHTFRPMNSVVRQDMAAFLYRLAGSPDYAPDEHAMSAFVDVTETTPHANEVWWLASTGVSEGWHEANGTRTFRPLSSIVRQDVAAFLQRTYTLESYEPEGEHTFLFAEDGSLVTGWADDGCFYDRASGARVDEGWIIDGDDRSYLDPVSGRFLTDGLHDVAGYSYLFDEAGLVQHGWADVEGAKRCFSPASGFMYADGIFSVDGARYGFSDDGSIVYGWAEYDGSTYYFDLSTGKMVRGITRIDGDLYWFDSSTGKMRTSGVTIYERCVYKIASNGRFVKSTFGQSVDAASAAQKRVASLAWNEPTTPSGWCAMWVHNVFEAYGITDVNGNANDLYYSYCTSSNPSELKVGMIVAVSRHPGTAGGRIYGHIGIYVGDGVMLDSSGEVRIWNVEDWIDSYDGWVTPKWGWYGGRSLK
ncbi:MAG: S-layer homology domain-containing protein [Atopobiaceae bacterium]|nr:S-layer homology domain-containing protein [Atopobiaceae bacterium]